MVKYPELIPVLKINKAHVSFLRVIVLSCVARSDFAVRQKRVLISGLNIDDMGRNYSSYGGTSQAAAVER